MQSISEVVRWDKNQNPTLAAYKSNTLDKRKLTYSQKMNHNYMVN